MHKKPKKFYKKANKKTNKDVIESELEQPQEFPKITRPITETKQDLAKKGARKEKIQYGLLTGIFLCLLIGVIALGGIFLLSGSVLQAYNQFTRIEQERSTMQLQVMQWQEVALLHPGSRDVYMKLALLTYQLHDFIEAKAYLDRSLFLDPNFVPALELQKILVGKV